MAELEDVVIAIEETNSILSSIEVKIDALNILLEDEALHNENVELFFDDLKIDMGLVNENLLLINDSQGGYLKEETLANNEWYYNQISEINQKISYSFIFYGVFIAFVLVYLIIKGFFKNASN